MAGFSDYQQKKEPKITQQRKKVAAFLVCALCLISIKIFLLNRETVPQWGFRLLALSAYLGVWYLLLSSLYQGWAGSNYADRPNPIQRFLMRFYHNKLATFGLFVVLTLAVMAIFADDIAIYPLEYQAEWQEFSQLPPCREHPLGTVTSGEDLFSLIVYGSRISLGLGVSVMVITSLVGMTLGATAGYFGKGTDRALNYLNDVVMSFPFLVFCIVLVGALQVNEAVRETFANLAEAIGVDMHLMIIFLVLAMLMWSSTFRVVRSQVLSLKETGFVEAAKALGGSSRRIIFKHLLPNTLGPVIVLVTIGIGSVILTEAALSYLGFGAEMTTPSWGRLLRDANPYVTQPCYMYMVMFPGIAIFMSVLGFTTMGDGLRDAIDPRMKV